MFKQEYFSSTYYLPLKYLNNIAFTAREIDIIASIVHGRTSKKAIANFLGIGPRTVETHTQNIIQKIAGMSRENIPDFVEKSDKQDLLRIHYEVLKLHLLFIDSISETSHNKQLKNIKFYLVGIEISAHFPNELVAIIKLLNAKGIDSTFEIVPNIEANLIYNIYEDKFVCLLVDKPIIDTSKIPERIFYANVSEYDDVFSLFIAIFRSIRLEETANKLETQYNKINLLNVKKIKNYLQSPEVNSNRKSWLRYGVAAFCCIVFIVSSLIYYKKNIPRIVRADLLLPHSEVLLPRESLFSEIQKKLIQNDGHSIPIVVLVGMGGVGKSTIARMVAQKSRLPIVWEIDAETPATIANSFYSLAIALAETLEDKNKLTFIKQIQNKKEKHKQRLAFVREKLKETNGWLLIYDNVERYSDILHYLPQDIKIWGKNGQVILTTRNAHIKEVAAIKAQNVITINSLSDQDVLTLFVQIQSKCNPLFSSKKELTNLYQFLSHIPPFPLDVSIASRYMCQNYSYEEYLEKLTQQERRFYNSQELLLKEISEYTDTRYKIITLSIEKILALNPVYQELLLFISLLDSQQIPKELLELHYGKITLDCFIHELKKYSIITSEKIINGVPTISVHRSIQAICKAYFIRKLKLTENHSLIKFIYNIFSEYIRTLLYKQSILNLKFLERHCKHLIKEPLFPDYLRYKVMLELGCAYLHLGKDQQCEEILKEGLDKLLTLKKIDPIVSLSNSILSTLYRKQGNFYKALAYLQKSLAVDQTLNDHIQYGHNLGSLGQIYIDTSQYKKAEEVFKESIVILKQYTNLPTNLPRSLLYLGVVYRELGDYKNAMLLAEEGEKLYRQMDSILSSGWALTFLASIYGEMGEYKKAKMLFKKGISLFLDVNMGNHTCLEWIYSFLGSIYRKMGKYKKAKLSVEKAIEIYKKNNSTGYNYMLALVHLGKIYLKMGKYDLAKKYLEEGSASYVKLYGEKNLRIAWVNDALGLMHLEMKMYKQAKEIFKKNIEFYTSYLNRQHIKVGKNLIRLGRTYLYLGDPYKAEPLLMEGLRIYEINYGKDHLYISEVFQVLGELYLALGNLEKSEFFLEDALKILKTNKEVKDHPNQHLVLETLADLYTEKAEKMKKNGLLQDAKQYKQKARGALVKALVIAENVYPPGSMHTQRIKKRISWDYDFLTYLKVNTIKIIESIWNNMRRLNMIKLK